MKSKGVFTESPLGDGSLARRPSSFSAPEVSTVDEGVLNHLHDAGVCAFTPTYSRRAAGRVGGDNHSGGGCRTAAMRVYKHGREQTSMRPPLRASIVLPPLQPSRCRHLHAAHTRPFLLPLPRTSNSLIVRLALNSRLPDLPSE